MAEAVYLLSAVLSLGCAAALLRTYRSTRTRVLLWSSACFLGLAATNVLLFIDLVIFPGVDMSLPRAWLGAVAVLALVVGLIWDVD